MVAAASIVELDRVHGGPGSRMDEAGVNKLLYMPVSSDEKRKCAIGRSAITSHRQDSSHCRIEILPANDGSLSRYVPQGLIFANPYELMCPTGRRPDATWPAERRPTASRPHSTRNTVDYRQRSASELVCCPREP